MNFVDYQNIMVERNLITNPIAEKYLAAAVVLNENIKVLKEDGKLDLIPEYQKRKDWNINKAIQTSWGSAELIYMNNWEKYCIQVRNNIIDGGATREVTLIGTRDRPMNPSKRIEN